MNSHIFSCVHGFFDTDHDLLNLLFYKSCDMHLKSIGAREGKRRRGGEGSRGPALCAVSAGTIMKDSSGCASCRTMK